MTPTITNHSIALGQVLTLLSAANCNPPPDTTLHVFQARMTAGGAATAGDEGDFSEFPDLASFFGEEECSLDAWLALEPSSSSATMSSREEEADEREFLEDMEAWHLLRSWCVSGGRPGEFGKGVLVFVYHNKSISIHRYGSRKSLAIIL